MLDAFRARRAVVTWYVHARVGRAVDDDALAALVDVVVEAEEGSDAVHEHTVVGRHLRELEVLVPVGEATGSQQPEVISDKNSRTIKMVRMQTAQKLHLHIRETWSKLHPTLRDGRPSDQTMDRPLEELLIEEPQRAGRTWSRG